MKRACNTQESLLVKKDPKASQYALKIDILKSMKQPQCYESKEPGTLRDIALREHTNLVKISDEAADFFYRLYSELSIFLKK